jgi:ABC-2 type transport system permease protein
MAELVVFGRVARAACRSAVLWGALFGLVVFSSAQGFVATYPTRAGREQLARSLGTNQGVRALFGPTRRIDTVAGFTAWRSTAVVALIAGIWGLLLATKLLRGAEEDGRWERLLAGATTRRRGTAQGLGGLAAGLFALWAVTATISAAVGRTHDTRFSITASAFLAVAQVANAAVFLAVGALCSQLVPTRRRAATIAGAVFGVSFATRLVAESGRGLHWLRWATPFGWISELRPLTGSNPGALVPIVASCALLATVTVVLAGRRDVGAGIVPARETADARTRLLGNPFGLALRLNRSSALGWAGAVGGLGLVLGLVAESAGQATAGSDAARQVLARLGAHGSGASVYLGVAFLFAAAILGLAAASQVAATREEESSRRLEDLLARPVSCTGWLSGRLAVNTAALLLMGIAAAVGAWLGTAIEATTIDVDRLFTAGLALVPIGLVVLGIGTLATGVAPRTASTIAYAVVAGSFVLELVGSVVDMNHWLRDLSLFHHLAPAPAVDPNWSSVLVLALIGLVSAAVGVVLVARRDLVDS